MHLDKLFHFLTHCQAEPVETSFTISLTRITLRQAQGDKRSPKKTFPQTVRLSLSKSFSIDIRHIQNLPAYQYRLMQKDDLQLAEMHFPL